MLQKKEEADSDDEEDDANEEQSKVFDFAARSSRKGNRLDKPILSKDEQEKVNDDLLYDPDEEEEDEKWMINERLKYDHNLSFKFHF